MQCISNVPIESEKRNIKKPQFPGWYLSFFAPEAYFFDTVPIKATAHITINTCAVMISHCLSFPLSSSVSLSLFSCLTPLCRSPSRALLILGFTLRTTRGTQTTSAGSRSGSISSTAEPQGNTSRSWGRKSMPMEMMGASMVWENSCASHLTL